MTELLFFIANIHSLGIESYLSALKNKAIMINEVPYEKLLEIRHQVMYPEKDRDVVILPDDDRGIHMGYFIEEKPISIFSLFLDNRELQFRKFATLQEYQGKGYGSKMLQWLIDYARDMKFTKIWCNSWIDKSDFYKKFGFTETSNIFQKQGHTFIVMEMILV